MGHAFLLSGGRTGGKVSARLADDEERKKGEKLLLRLLRAWYGMMPMTSSGVYLCGCIMFFCFFLRGPRLLRQPFPQRIPPPYNWPIPLKARVGMAAEMLDTGETVMVGDEAAYPMQSVVKFCAGLVRLEAGGPGRHESGTDHPHTSGTTGERYLEPLRERFPQGGDFSLKELLRVTVQESDNNTCDLPVWPYWRAAYRAEGFEGMGN